MLHKTMAQDDATIADTRITADQEFVIVLKPLSHPELGDIRIDDNLFAIGRTEPPFESYPPEIVADLSRRHARLFYEHGAVYVADLDSKNGTTVNGVNVQQKITRLQDGDEVCFGKTLSYRVRLGARVGTPGRVAKLVSLTLTPEHTELGVQPIVIKQFPFLISKADDAFSRYKDDYPHQVNYISRRHAHIFLKGGSPFIEDLGSTNGTFVAGNRLEERAVALDDGDVVAFGGHHFVYTVSLLKEDAEVDPTVTKLATAMPATVRAPGDHDRTVLDQKIVGKTESDRTVSDKTISERTTSDKTTFVAAADSFLDIFCVDHAQKQDDEVNDEAARQAEEARKEAEKRPPRGKAAIFMSELADAFMGKDRSEMKRASRRGLIIAAVAGAIGVGIYLIGTPERNLKGLIEEGNFDKAAVVASQSLERNPDSAEIRKLATESLLKSSVPKWLAALKARDYAAAEGILGGMRQLVRHNPDAEPVVNELAWIGDLEKFVLSRGGVEAPVRIYVDEDQIRSLLKRWEDNSQWHQSVFTTIASNVPEFRDLYAESISHLRKLQSDESVYLAAIERLKTTIASELRQDRPEALEPVLNEYAEKYPRLGGLDSVRQDLRQYAAIENDARARRLGPLVMRLSKARFATPPFQDKFRALASSSKIPPQDVVQQSQAASRAWRSGDAKQAFAALQTINAGSWSDAATRELQQKKTILDQFSMLEKARGAAGYDEKLLAFYGSLDPEEDAYFAKAIENDINQYRGKALGHAQELLNRAQAQYRQYRDNGGIEGSQRIEAGISSQFRNQARLLAGAHDGAQQGMRIYKQLKAAYPAEWNKVQEEINAEAELQRRSLQDLRMVLEPGLLKQKLALLGGPSDEERKPPSAADRSSGGS